MPKGAWDHKSKGEDLLYGLVTKGADRGDRVVRGRLTPEARIWGLRRQLTEAMGERAKLEAAEVPMKWLLMAPVLDQQIEELRSELAGIAADMEEEE